MYLTFRWFGPADPVTLERIRQIPGVAGIVSALDDVPVGDAWPREELERLRDQVESAGLALSVIESLPVHEDIKLGRPGRDRLLESYCRSVERVGAVGVRVICYNFMPVFDWVRTDVALRLEDGSLTLAFDQDRLDHIDLSRGTEALPGWAAAYPADELERLLAAYRDWDAERLWESLTYFLERVVPVAEGAGVNLAIHPDDPPWSVFGLPRIVTSGEALDRVTRLVDRPANGVTLCTGSLGADLGNDVPAIARRLGKRGRIHFAHGRNVRVTGPRRFHETPHPSAYGSVDLPEVVRALHEVGFAGPMRSDHGRMIWGETGRPGYGLHDRALGAVYLQGLWEGVRPSTHASQV